MQILALILAMALPHLTPSYQVTVEKDVPYATAMGYYTHAPVGDKGSTFKLLFHSGIPKPVTLEMDIYRPSDDTNTPRPLLLMMHGGSFFIGHKSEPGQAGWCEYFASLGYVAVSINYRLGFHPTKKEIRQAEYRALEDADAALEYLFGREDLLIDKDRVFIAGTSAGAMTALNLAFRLYGSQPMKEVQPRLGREDFRIRAIANLWGSVHDLSVLENASVPILSFQSVNDPVMPYDFGYPLGFAGRLLSDPMYGTHAVYEKALELGLRAEHHPCPEARHRLHLDDAMAYTERFYEIRDAMVKFFAAEME
ncbi:MAG: alpha/beta hydrolase [Bacteroidales bacterium]|nr:alpha/beta hydrolase [Bacteroidales bacterium]